MSKPNSRSFRYSDKVSEILAGFSGSNMNDKFENLVLYCFDKVESRKKELKQVEEQINAKRKEYSSLCHNCADIGSLIQTLETIKYYGEIAAKKSEQLAKNLEYK